MALALALGGRRGVYQGAVRCDSTHDFQAITSGKRVLGCFAVPVTNFLLWKLNRFPVCHMPPAIVIQHIFSQRRNVVWKMKQASSALAVPIAKSMKMEC